MTVALLTVALLMPGCGGSGDDGPCGPVRREPLDPRAVHLVPGADPPEYKTEPPTSGPHLPSPSTQSVREEPISYAVQVGLLEEGIVLLQHRALSGDDRSRIEDLAGDAVTVAPAPSLPDDAKVVATAWVTKQVCDRVDVEALRRFVDDNRDRGPDSHG